MTTHQFIQINQLRVVNIDGCLTDQANVTILTPEGKLMFYYFENGKLTHSKSKVQGW